MAEPQIEGQDQRLATGGKNGRDASDELPDDIDALRALVLEERKKAGTLLNENKITKKARDELSAKVKSWSRLEEEGYTPEQIEQIIGKTEQESLDKARSQGEIDKLLQNQTKKHEKETESIKSQLESERKINNEIMIDNLLIQELNKVVEPKLLKGAFHLHRERCKTIDDPTSTYGRRTVVEVGGEYMSVPDFIKNWAETDDEADAYLKASLASGGGANGGGGARARLKGRKEMTPKEKSAYIRQFGLAEYDRIPWERT